MQLDNVLPVEAASKTPRLTVAFFHGQCRRQPVFIPGWWSQLSRSQRTGLTLFMTAWHLVSVLLATILTRDANLEHSLYLVGLTGDDVDQKIRFNLSVHASLGFWTERLSLQAEYSSTYQTIRPDQLFQAHFDVGKKLWNYCIGSKAHRASAFSWNTFLLLTTGLSGLYMGPYLIVFNRILMLAVCKISFIAIGLAYALAYAASIEIHNCLLYSQLNTNNRGFQGRYFTTSFEVDSETSRGLSGVCLGIVLPATLIGIWLVIARSNNL